MGRFDFEVSTEFLKTLGKLSQIDKVAPQMVDEALPLCTDVMKRDFQSAGHPYSDNVLINSIKEKDATQDKNGAWRGITRPTGKDGKIRNMEKLAYYEYGTSHQPARPIMDKIKNDAKAPAQEKMEAVFKREMGI